VEERDEEAAYRRYIFELDHEPRGVELQYPKLIDNPTRRTAVVLHEIKSLAGFHLGDGEIWAPAPDARPLDCARIGDKDPPIFGGSRPVLDSAERRNGPEPGKKVLAVSIEAEARRQCD